MSRKNFKKKIYLRADGNSKIGFGHVARLLALADILCQDFECVFVTTADSPFLQQQLARIGIRILQLPPNLNVEEELEFICVHISPQESIIVLDGYGFNHFYQSHLKDRGFTLVYIDDLRAFHQVADVVINPAQIGQKHAYSSEDYTKIYSGVGYALLRRPFLEAAVKPRDSWNSKSLFISFGGADVDGLSCRAVKAALETQKFHRVSVVVSSVFSHISVLTKMAEEYPDLVSIYQDLSAHQLVDLMSSCGVAVASSSTVSYELCCVGIGLFAGYYVDNQLDIYNGLKDEKCIFPAGNFANLSHKEWVELLEEMDEERISNLIATQKKLFSGGSDQNLKQVFNEL